MGNIGSHVDLTSVRNGHQAKTLGVAKSAQIPHEWFQWSASRPKLPKSRACRSRSASLILEREMERIQRALRAKISELAQKKTRRVRRRPYGPCNAARDRRYASLRLFGHDAPAIMG
jgi:hypothetical protein